MLAVCPQCSLHPAHLDALKLPVKVDEKLLGHVYALLCPSCKRILGTQAVPTLLYTPVPEKT